LQVGGCFVALAQQIKKGRLMRMRFFKKASEIRFFKIEADPSYPIGQEIERAQFIRLSTLAQAGLSRIFYWVGTETPFAILSAERHHLQPKENGERTEALARELAKLKLRGILLKGHYGQSGDEIPHPEIAFFVPCEEEKKPEFREAILGLGRGFDQESVLYSAGESISLLNVSDGRPKLQFSRLSFDPQKMTDVYSELRGRKFAFLESAVGPETGMGRCAWDLVGLAGGVALGHLRKLYELGIAR
jgi:hypothetical protein